jgi:hypothetical protein
MKDLKEEMQTSHHKFSKKKMKQLTSLYFKRGIRTHSLTKIPKTFHNPSTRLDNK